MATDNYLKIYRHPRPAVEFFFDGCNPTSVASALRAAREHAGALTELGQAEADAASSATKATPQIADPARLTVWAHGVRGLGDLHCVGGCELCSPRSEESLDDDEGEEAESAA